MNAQDILAIYMAQSENVRHLGQVIDVFQKNINHDIRKSDHFQLEAKTKIFLFLYTAWSEAQFVQIAYTDNGFMDTEIVKILRHKERHGIAEGWKYMVDLALNKVGDTNLNRDLKNRLSKLLKLIEEYIQDPVVLRNKIAHGQWIKALNRENTSINSDVTGELGSLDPIQITKRIQVHKYLGFIIRDLVQSPKAGFHNYYWTNITNLEQYLRETDKWTLESKRKALLKKPITYKN